MIKGLAVGVVSRAGEGKKKAAESTYCTSNHDANSDDPGLGKKDASRETWRIPQTCLWHYGTSLTRMGLSAARDAAVAFGWPLSG